MNIDSLKDLIDSNLNLKEKEELILELLDIKLSKKTLNLILDNLINKSFDNNFNPNLFIENNRAKDIISIIDKNDKSFLNSCGSCSKLIYYYIPDTEDYFEFSNNKDETYLMMIKKFDKAIKDMEKLKKSFIKDKCKFGEG